MKLTEIPIVQVIKDNFENRGYYPHDGHVSSFIKEIIPYLEQLEERLAKIERGGREG